MDIHTIKDLVPYYPYLVFIGSRNKDDNGEFTSNIILSSESFVTQEERQNLRRAFKLICERKYLLSEVANHLEEQFSDDKNVLRIVEFIRTTKRGIYLRKDSCMSESFEE